MQNKSLNILRGISGLLSMSIFCCAYAANENHTVTAPGMTAPSLTAMGIASVLFFVVILLLILKIKKSNQKLRELNDEVKYLRRTDELTQIFNKRYMEKRLYQVFERHIRNKTKNSVLMKIGIDDFLNLITEKGQSVADRVVKNTAELILERIRNTDLCGRYSSSEFMVLLRDTTTEPAEKMAEKLLEKIVGTPVLFEEHKIIVSCSIGLQAYSEKMDSCRDWIQQTNQALNLATQYDSNLSKIK